MLGNHRHQLLRKALAIVLASWLFSIGPRQNAVAAVSPEPVAPLVLQQATTHHVAPGGNCGGALPCYSTIQAALDATVDGDTVKVASGTYTSPTAFVARVIRSILLEGGYSPSNWTTPDLINNKTVIDPQNQIGRRGIFVDGELAPAPLQVTVQGFSVVNAQNVPPQSCSGICVVNSNAVIRNNHVYSSTSAGIQVVFSTAVVENNLVENKRRSSPPEPGQSGIVLEASAATLIGNTVRRSGNGIYAFDGSSLTAFNNFVEGNTNGIYTYHCAQATLENNFLQDNGTGVRASDTPINPITLTLQMANNNVVKSSGTGVSISALVTGMVQSNVISDSASTGVNLDPLPPRLGLGIALQQNLITLNGGNGINVNPPNNLMRMDILSNTVSQHQATGVRVRITSGSSLSIIGNLIEYNNATSVLDNGGGGIFVSGSGGLFILRNRIVHNNTNGPGGGIYINSGSSSATISVTLNANQILTNTSLGEGSGLAVGDGGRVTAYNDIIARNYVELPAVYVFRGALNIRHWTIANNGSYAIRAFQGGQVTIQDSIIAGHKLGGLLAGEFGTIVATRTLSFNNPAICVNNAICSDTIEGDPRFVSDALLNFHIKPGSAAIDQATPSEVTDDIDGLARPVGPAPDIGADEFGNLEILVSEAFLPLVARSASQ